MSALTLRRQPAMTARTVLVLLMLTFSQSLLAQYWTRMPTDAEVQTAAESFVHDLLTRRQQEPCHLSTRTTQKVTRLHHQTDAAWFMAHLQLTLTTTRQAWDSRTRACDDSVAPSTTSDELYATLMQDAQSGGFYFGTTLSSLPEYLESHFAEGWSVAAPTTDPAATPGRYRATIRIAPLTPGEVLSPSVEVVDENGQPPSASIYVSWFINGVNTPSVVWDGSETRVEVQVSVANQALVEAVLIPAYQSGAPSAATPTAPTLTLPTEVLPTEVLPTGPVPGLGGVGPLQGPGSLGQALVGTLLPPLLITLGQLLAGIRGWYARAAVAGRTAADPGARGDCAAEAARRARHRPGVDAADRPAGAGGEA
jgi:hypothetical protein